jgi:tryptophan halogenase
MWNIPLQNRIGSGYVYSSDFLTDEEAHQEAESFLGKKITPIKYISFDSGASKEFWKKNCIAVGLSGAFNEPLEATSIHSTVYQILAFSFNFLSRTVEDTATESNIKTYNKEFKTLYEDFKDFLVLHYQGGRDDSDFWKYIKTEETKTDFVKDILEISKKRVPSITVYNSSIGATQHLWNWILSGLDILNVESAKKDLQLFGLYGSTEQMYKEFNEYYNYLDNTDLEFKINLSR